MDLLASLRGPRGGWGAGGCGGQVHPAGPTGQHVAFVESADTVVFIVDIVGDVLQVLEVGAGRWMSGQLGIATVTPRPTMAPGLLAPSPDKQVSQEGKLTVRHVLHCKIGH